MCGAETHPLQVATLPKREDLQEVDKVSVFLIKAMSRRQSLTSPFPLTLPFREGRNLLRGGFRRPPRHIKISRHGLEIRGSEHPIVQGTEEITLRPSNYCLNVASTVGTFQPRISNPWLSLCSWQPLLDRLQRDIIEVRPLEWARLDTKLFQLVEWQIEVVRELCNQAITIADVGTYHYTALLIHSDNA